MDRNAQRVGARVAAIVAVITGGIAFFLHWEPHADFDITGVLWLMQNVIPLLALLVAVVSAGLALGWWVSSRRSRG